MTPFLSDRLAEISQRAGEVTADPSTWAAYAVAVVAWWLFSEGTDW